jgi:hypothetical protein
MVPMKKAVIIFIGVCLAGIMGTCIYFVAGVSATFPPIKTYDYPGRITELKSKLDSLCAVNHNISYVFTDTTGGPKYRNTYAYYITVYDREPKATFEYAIKYSSTDYHFSDNKTTLSLIMAYDTIRHVGGYGIDAVGIKPLIINFDKNIMSYLTHDKY